MKTLIIYYSYTGNNGELAEKIAEKMGADLYRIIEKRERTTKSIIFDMLLNRNPRLKGVPENVENYDLVVFIAPVWIFKIASPLRTCFKHLKNRIKKYGFITVSGGALGPNTKIASELVKRLGKNMAVQLDFTIANFLSVGKNPTSEETGKYKLEEHPDDLEWLTNCSVNILQKINI